MSIDEHLESLRNMGEDGSPEDIYTQIKDEYDHDMTTRDAKIAKIEADLADSSDRVAELKSRNYDLMVSTPKVESDDDSAYDGDKFGIDSLFE